MSSYRRIASCLAGCALLGTFSGPSYAITTATEAIAPKAAQVLRNCADYFEQAKTISVTINTSMVSEVEDTKQEIPSLYHAQIQRPDKIALVLKEGSFYNSVYSDGTTQTLYYPSQNAYVQRPAPDTLDELLNVRGIGRGIHFASIIWNSKPYSSFMDGVTSGIYVGTTNLDGIPCHHLKFAQELFEWEAWVAAEETSPTLLQLKMEHRSASDARKKGSGLEPLRSGFTVKYTDWKMNQPIPAETFKFAPPSGATNASEFYE